ncbi:hypothetical protein Emag_000008 [Eimeria magna]
MARLASLQSKESSHPRWKKQLEGRTSQLGMEFLQWTPQDSMFQDTLWALTHQVDSRNQEDKAPEPHTLVDKQHQQDTAEPRRFQLGTTFLVNIS